jgi:hypothetical protein
MKDMQAQLAKIRADAAECLLLGTIGSGEKKKMFVGMAEHLNGLALEIEKSMMHSANQRQAAPQSGTIMPELATADQHGAIAPHSIDVERARPSRLRRAFLPVTAIMSILVIGSLFWSDVRVAGDLSSLLGWRTRQASPKPPPVVAVAEPKPSNDRLAALDQRVANIESALERLRLEHRETMGASGQRLPTEQAFLSVEGKPSTLDDKPTPNETASISPRDSAAAKPMDSASAASANALARIDHAGPMALTGAKPATGPAGCTRFRSFDPVSGTYTTLDGRHRPCS